MKPSLVLILVLCSALCLFGQSRRVAVTFDDLPMQGADATANPGEVTREMADVNGKLLKAIAADRVPAIGFVNEGKLYARGEVDARIGLLRAWLDAGLDLGNHTYSHIQIDRATLDDYRDDIIRGETVTKMLLGERLRKLVYFRHPQLRTGPTEEYRKGLASFLEKRGYTVAPVTIDNQEWVFAGIYARAKARRDAETMKMVGAEYVAYMERVFSFFEELSAETFGREIPQVLLLHANALNADYFTDLAAMTRRRGYRFVTVGEALADNVYQLPDAQTTRGLSWIHRWRLGKGLTVTEEPREPEKIAEMFRKYGSS